MLKNKKDVGLVTYTPILLTTEFDGSITATYERNIEGDKPFYFYIAVSNENVFVDIGGVVDTPHILDILVFLEIDARKVNITFEVLQSIVQDLWSALKGEKDYLWGYQHTGFDKSLNIHKDKPTKFPLMEIPRNVYTEKEILNLQSL